MANNIKNKKRKSRLAIIEDGAPASKETPKLPPTDGQIVQQLLEDVSALEQRRRTLTQQIKAEPRKNLEIEHFNNQILKSLDVSNSLEEVQQKINAAANAEDLPKSIRYLTEKKQILEHSLNNATETRIELKKFTEKYYSKPQPHTNHYNDLTKLAAKVKVLKKQLEDELKDLPPNPNVLSIEGMSGFLNSLVGKVTGQVTKATSENPQNPFVSQALQHQEALNSHVIALLATLKIQYDQNKGSITTEQLHKFIDAQHNFDLIYKKFKNDKALYQQKTEFNQKIQHLSQKADFLQEVQRQLALLPTYTDQQTITAELKSILLDNDRPINVVFHAKDFPSTQNGLPTAELNQRAKEIDSLFEQVQTEIQLRQSQLMRNKAELGYIAQRNHFINFLLDMNTSNLTNRNYRPLSQAIVHQFNGSDPKKDGLLLRELILNHGLTNTTAELIDTFKLLANELLAKHPKIELHGETFTYLNKEYPLTAANSAQVKAFAEARTVFSHALEQGDKPGEDYNTAYRKLQSAQKALDAYIKTEELYSQQRNTIDTLINKISAVMNQESPPSSEKTPQKVIDAQRTNFTTIIDRLSTLKDTIKNQPVEENAQVIAQSDSLFKELNTLNQAYINEATKLDELARKFNGVIKEIVNETERLTNKEPNKAAKDPRIEKLVALKDSMTKQKEQLGLLQIELHSISSTPLVNNLEVKQTEQKLSDFSKKTDKHCNAAIDTVQATLSDENLKQLTEVTQNKFILFLAKLIRPLIKFLDKHSPAKPGIVHNQTELKIKLTRDRYFAQKDESHAEDPENKTPNKGNAK